MTLAEHLAKGYDFYVHGIMAIDKWKKSDLVNDLRQDGALVAEATAKLGELQKVIDAGRRCDVSKIQYRILKDALSVL